MKVGFNYHFCELSIQRAAICTCTLVEAKLDCPGSAIKNLDSQSSTDSTFGSLQYLLPGETTVKSLSLKMKKRHQY